MSLSRQHALTLPATPRAVKLARDWVGRVLTEIHREDLVASAELGVSELVTNAIIHSAPPVAVRIRGTQAHPRIEVADRSLVPPRPLTEPEILDEDELLTFGRGLALVARHAVRWGSDIDAFGLGKTVWFEPADEPREADFTAGDLFDLGQLAAQPPVEDDDAIEYTEVQLLATPVTALSDVRRKYNELRRELRLLGLANPDRYPLAVEFSEVALLAEIGMRRSSGFDSLLDAERNNVDRADLTLHVATSLPPLVSRLSELLGRVYSFFDDEDLLAVAPTSRQRQVQAWYLTEMVRQGEGLAPTPWTGGYREHQRAETAS